MPSIFNKPIASIRQFVVSSRNQRLKAETAVSIPLTETNFIDLGAEELFNEINSSKLDMVGQVSTAYEAHEYNFGINVQLGDSIDALGLEIGIEAALEVGGSMTNYKFLVVQKFPNQFTRQKIVQQQTNSIIQNNYGFQNVLTNVNVLVTETNTIVNPIMLAKLTGKAWAFKAGINIFAGASFEGPQIQIPQLGNVSELVSSLTYDQVCIGDAISLSLDISAEASAKYQYSTMSLVDESPWWFPSIADPRFLNSLEANAGIGKKKLLQIEILNWIKNTYRSEQFLVELVRAARSFLDIAISSNKTMYAITTALLYEQENNNTDSSQNIQKLQHYKFLVGAGISADFSSGSKVDCIKIIEKIQNLGFTQIRAFQQRGVGTFLVYETSIFIFPHEMNTQYYVFRFNDTNFNTQFTILRHSNVQNRAPTEIVTLQIFPAPLFNVRDFTGVDTRNVVTNLHYSGHNGGASAGLSATVFEQGLSTELSGEIKKAKYRLQTYYPFPQAHIFYTQDVKVKYKQAVFNAGAKLLVEKNYEKECSSIEYKATICVWEADNNVLNPICFDGSGVAFGVSISINTINKWNRLSPTHPMKQILAIKLRVSVQDLDILFSSLISKLSLTGSLTEDDLGAPAVIIESTFAAVNEPIIVRTKYGSKPFLSNVTFTNFESVDRFGRIQFNGNYIKRFLRVRTRVADMIEKNGRSFKLGMSIGAANIGIKLYDITKAGSEGVVDVFTLDLGTNLEYNETTPPPKIATPAGQKDAPYVGPVTLILQ